MKDLGNLTFCLVHFGFTRYTRIFYCFITVAFPLSGGRTSVPGYDNSSRHCLYNSKTRIAQPQRNTRLWSTLLQV
ncbi:hypothetical protein Ae201684P_019484 [Aphanomyces euteiches]|nr:hypothetical protein Ae201684P_019484 [Aphanomyces euteiches]